MTVTDFNYLKAAKLIKNARSIVILAGAGMSEDSGSKTYEDSDELLRDFPELQKEGITTYKEMAKAKWFARKPHLAWVFANHSIAGFQQNEPHQGYQILKSWVDAKHSGCVITTNVDNAFYRSGFTRVFELHGNHFHLQCIDNCTNTSWQRRESEVPAPRCPHCGKSARPNIMYFEDSHFCFGRYEKQSADYRQLMEHTMLTNPLAIENGAGILLPRLRQESLKFDNIIRINPKSDADFGNANTVHIQDSALTAITRLDALLNR